MKFILKIIVILLVIAVVPIILGQLLRIPTGVYTIGDESAWVGFFGNYSGGIIGGIVAYIIATNESKQTKEQLKQQLHEQENQEKQQKEMIFDIVNLFLKEEIDGNIGILSRNKYLDNYLEENEQPFQFGHNWSFNTSQFEQLKFDIIKYKNNALIKEVLSIYKTLLVLNRTTDINQLSQKQYEDFKKNYYFWKTWINEAEIVLS